MQGSQFTFLQQPNIIVLCAGHGGGDRGASPGGHHEDDETKILTDLIAADLKTKGIDIYIVPHELGLSKSIRHVNSRFAYDQAWAIEIHRDSADNTCPFAVGELQKSSHNGALLPHTFANENLKENSGLMHLRRTYEFCEAIASLLAHQDFRKSSDCHKFERP